MSFEEYLIWAKDNIDKTKSDQYAFLSNESNELLVDFVGKIETIDRSFEEIKDKLSLNTSLPHKNKSSRSDSYRQYYSSEGIAIVEAMNKKDLEYFNYEF